MLAGCRQALRRAAEWSVVGGGEAISTCALSEPPEEAPGLPGVLKMMYSLSSQAAEALG